MNTRAVDRIVALAAQGKDVGEIRRIILDEMPLVSRGALAGMIFRLRRAGVEIKENEISARARLANQSRTAESRRVGAVNAARTRNAHLLDEGAHALELARERSARAARAEDMPPPPPLPIVIPKLSMRTCSWVDGQRGAWVLCEARAMFGKPFCEEHAKRGMVACRARPAGAVDAAGSQT